MNYPKKFKFDTRLSSSLDKGLSCLLLNVHASGPRFMIGTLNNSRLDPKPIKLDGLISFSGLVNRGVLLLGLIELGASFFSSLVYIRLIM